VAVTRMGSSFGIDEGVSDAHARIFLPQMFRTLRPTRAGGTDALRSAAARFGRHCR